MPLKYERYWYKESQDVACAFLYNCRDADLRAGEGIARGDIVQGCCGFVAAESLVPNFTGCIRSFQPNRRCSWQGFELPCMAHPAAPKGKAPKQELRPFNYLVAELNSPEARTQARQLDIPIIATSQGLHLVNLECSTFEKQGRKSPRRADLL